MEYVFEITFELLEDHVSQVVNILLERLISTRGVEINDRAPSSGSKKEVWEVQK